MSEELDYFNQYPVINTIPTPCFCIDEELLIQNLKLLRFVADRASCKILLAQKAFSMFSVYPLLAQYLDGTTSSGLYETRLGKEEFGKETHAYSAAFIEEEFEELLAYADDIVFNSPLQLEKFGSRAKKAGKSVGLRINPEHSTQDDHTIYDPCASGSRLGTTRSAFLESQLPLIDGFHMHTLCEQNSDALEETVAALEEKFGSFLHGLKWINLGGGHHITRPDYDIERLIRIIQHLKETYQVDVYLEPGEAVVYYTGFLMTKVIDIVENGMKTAILDTSAACHMPDVIEMPYRPPLRNSGASGERSYTYRLAGPTCLAGDIIGDYSFDRPLKPGDLLEFEDMALYTMVKTNTFNGMKLPSIVIRDKEKQLHLIRSFGYSDFKMRLS
ncbi:MAG: carboxynorspermidine decarboxylase [Lachnospiraceae bacterium]